MPFVLGDGVNPSRSSKWMDVDESKSNLPCPLNHVLEIPRKAILEFKEHTMYRSKKLISIEFKEAGREELMQKVQSRYLNLQVRFNAENGI
jgi:hypothetical protein